MSRFSKSVRYYGSDEPLPQAMHLRAGPLTAHYQDGALRYNRLAGEDVLLQIYAAVRDHNWGTVMPRLSDEQVDAQLDSFRISYTAEHRQGDIDFVWQGVITGASDGTIIFTMDGQAHSTFRRNRIGFCVLHPMNCAGKSCTVEHVDGTITEGIFPDHIAPHQPYFDIRAITHEAAPGVKVEVRMEGDTFEMEDQRNWTDASYKTYCTPLGLPFPATVKAGTKIAQTITLRLHGDTAGYQQTGDSRQEAITLTVPQSTRKPLPHIGLGTASHGNQLTRQEIERLKALHLVHLRVDIHLSASEYEVKLTQATNEAWALGVKLEAALHLTDAGETELQAFRDVLTRIKPPVCIWLIFHAQEKSTSAHWVALARQYLADYEPDALIGAGTDAFFTELNRERPPVEALDLVTYSLNPQVHAFDNASLVEALRPQAVTVESARSFVGNLPVVVSPVTLTMRFNPNATGPEPEPQPGELPPQVDVRQMSLFGAGWTLGSIKYLAESGAHSLTYYETTGWRGVMETVGGSPLPDQFISIPGSVFPLYHVLADVGEFAGGEVILAQSSRILEVDGLVLRKNNQTRILLANFTPETQITRLSGVQGSGSLRSLDETNVEQAMRAPEEFRAQPGQQIAADGDELAVELLPYAVVRLDGVSLS
jgi:D-apionolactonase